jgi:hypothetical protein
VDTTGCQRAPHKARPCTEVLLLPLRITNDLLAAHGHGIMLAPGQALRLVVPHYLLEPVSVDDGAAGRSLQSSQIQYHLSASVNQMTQLNSCS